MDYCVKFCVNDESVELSVSGSETLLHVLREKLGYTGTKEGCGAGECGACTIIMDGQAVNACLVLAPEVNGKVITTVEGLACGETLSPLAGIVHRPRRAAMRLLHARHAHERRSDAPRKPHPHARRDQPQHVRQPLPLHGV